MQTLLWTKPELSKFQTNNFVSIQVMYSYYSIALMEIKNLLWLKKHITQLQIVQFLLVLVHAAYFILQPYEACQWPKIFPAMEFVHGSHFLYMFSSFYYHVYVKNPKVQEKKLG